MNPIQDIGDRADIDRLVACFYEKAMTDAEIGYLFTEVVQLELTTHLPRIADFWETVLLGVPRYKGSPLDVHVHLHRLSPLDPAHFARWVALFQETVDALFAGPVATLAKQRAESIATIMQLHLGRHGAS